MFLSRSPSKDFKFLIDKVEAKLTGWEADAYPGQVDTHLLIR